MHRSCPDHGKPTPHIHREKHPHRRDARTGQRRAPMSRGERKTLTQHGAPRCARTTTQGCVWAARPAR
eukprot:1707936-Alexandrium_andersonii.AAC.1